MATTDEIRARWAAATPGPWHNDNGGDEGVIRVWFRATPGDDLAGFPEGYGLTVACVLFPGDMETYEGPDFRTAEAIARAPEDIAALLAEIERLRAVEQERRENFPARLAVAAWKSGRR